MIETIGSHSIQYLNDGNAKYVQSQKKQANMKKGVQREETRKNCHLEVPKLPQKQI